MFVRFTQMAAVIHEAVLSDLFCISLIEMLLCLLLKVTACYY